MVVRRGDYVRDGVGWQWGEIRDEGTEGHRDQETKGMRDQKVTPAGRAGAIGQGDPFACSAVRSRSISSWYLRSARKSASSYARVEYFQPTFGK